MRLVLTKVSHGPPQACSHSAGRFEREQGRGGSGRGEVPTGHQISHYLYFGLFSVVWGGLLSWRRSGENKTSKTPKNHHHKNSLFSKTSIRIKRTSLYKIALVCESPPPPIPLVFH